MVMAAAVPLSFGGAGVNLRDESRGKYLFTAKYCKYSMYNHITHKVGGKEVYWMQGRKPAESGEYAEDI